MQEVRALVASGDLLTACEVLKSELGREPFIRFVKSHLQDPRFRPATIHETLWGLDLRIAITPNVDNIYDGVVVDRGGGTVAVKTFADDDVAETIRRQESILIKSHGTITTPNALIFTRSEYASARNKHREFYELIYSLLTTHTFLFVGCGLDDPDIRFLLEDYRYRYAYSQRHYFTIPRDLHSDTVLDALAESLNLNFVTYDSSDNHKALGDGLVELKNQVDLLRPELGRTQAW